MTKKTKKVKKVTPKAVNKTDVVRDPHKIIQDFQNLLIEADNFKGDDYKTFWERLREHGPMMLGISKAILTELEKSIEVLNTTQTMLKQAEQKVEEFKDADGSPGIHGMMRK
jgi:hypothetical protein